MNSLYPKLAVQGIRKNKKIYLPYILTCIGMVIMYYIISFLSYSKSVHNMKGGSELQTFLSIGTGIMAVFTMIFLFYTHSFIMKNRKKEFGLYNILGMGKGNITHILIWETLITYVISTASGLILGVIFSKLAELVSAEILGDTWQLGFNIDIKSVIKTLLLFAAAFGLILLNALRQIHLSNPINLLHSDKTGEKPPKARMLPALIGAVILGIAYYISCTIDDPMSAISLFFVAVIMVIAATYILFIIGSIALCKILQKNKKYYYKTEHFVSVSSMAYRMKRNGASLASICILSTMVLVIISSTMCLYIAKEDNLQVRYPRDIIMELDSADNEYMESLQESINKTLADCDVKYDNVLEYRYLSFGAIQKDSTTMSIDGDFNDFSKVKQIHIIPIEDYNALYNKNETLEKDEALIAVKKCKYDYDSINFESLTDLQIKNHADNYVSNGEAIASIFPSVQLLVSQEQFDKFSDYFNENDETAKYYYGFNIDCTPEEQIKIFEEISEDIKELQKSDSNFPAVSSRCAEKERSSFYALFGGLFFLGILLSIVFICAAILIMYYKQITEGFEDNGRFEIMQKVGMTKAEIRRSINSQILTVFTAPLIFAGLHICFAFPIIKKLLESFGLFDTGLLIAVTIGVFLAFAVFYIIVYKITSRSYYHIVSNKEV